MKERRSLIRIFIASMEITLGTVPIIAYIAHVIWFYLSGKAEYYFTADGLQALPAAITVMGKFLIIPPFIFILAGIGLLKKKWWGNTLSILSLLFIIILAIFCTSQLWLPYFSGKVIK